MRRLASAGLSAEVVSRRAFDAPEGFTTIRMDLTRAGDWRVPDGAVVVSFLPLWILGDVLPRLAGASSIIATGSTSRFSKANSGDAKERSTAAKLERAERTIQTWAETNNVTWTLLRPTMIYDGKTDRNIARMARFIKRWRFLPLAAPAAGLRQPIHTDDVAKAAFQCLNNPGAANKALNIAGGKSFPIARWPNACSPSSAKTALCNAADDTSATDVQDSGAVAPCQGIEFGASIFQRMNEDLIFDVAEGLDILDYRPRPFHPEV